MFVCVCVFMEKREGQGGGRKLRQCWGKEGGTGRHSQVAARREEGGVEGWEGGKQQDGNKGITLRCTGGKRCYKNINRLKKKRAIMLQNEVDVCV